MKVLLDTDSSGKLVRKTGVMGIVLEGGKIRTGTKISVELPSRPHLKLEPV